MQVVSERVGKTIADTLFPNPYALFVRLVAFSTALLIFIGATITTTGSGLAVPDWPFSFGTINPTMVGGVYYEHGHRLAASVVGFLVLCSAIWASLIRAHQTVRRLALLALGLVILQGLLGGLTVHLRLPTAVSAAHGTLAQIFFCTTIALVWWTSSAFVKAPILADRSAGKNLRIVAYGMTFLVFFQLLLGATMRHLGAGLVIPDFPTSLGHIVPPISSLEIAISFSHRVMAMAVFLMAVMLGVRIARFHRQAPALPQLGMFLVLAVLVQAILGAYTVWTGRDFWITCLHVTNGAVVLALSFSISIWTARLYRQSEGHSSESDDLPSDSIAKKISQVSRKDALELSKARLVSMSVFTAVCGFLLGSGSWTWVGLAVTVLGVALLGAGSSVLNHVVEVETDSLMERTRLRPLPTGRVDIALAERWGGILVAAGTLAIGLWQPLAGLLALAAFVSYVFMYTPMKRYSSSCTVVGAIPGALPVLIGYVLNTGRIDLGGIILFAILFLWQLPHFMAIAWLCKDDYARAGLPMATVVDPQGGMASTQVMAYCLTLIPVSLAPTLAGMTGPVYFYCALVLGLIYLYAGIALCLHCSIATARKLLLTSVLYLPLLYGCMVIGR